MIRLPTRALHPYLLALYPILLLYTRNSNLLYLRATLIAIVVVEVVTLGAGHLLRRLGVDAPRAGLTLSALLFLIFSFERNVYSWKTHEWGGSPDVREWAVLGVSTLAFGLWVWFLRSWPKLTLPLQSMANAGSMALLATLAPALWQAQQPVRTGSGPPSATAATPADWGHPAASRPASTPRPDIYFIILDAYGRSDVLRSMIGFDNRPWLDRMTRKGFYLATASTANYCQTALSVTASLNGQYHDRLAGMATKSRLPLREEIRASLFPQFLRAQGYRLVSFASGFGLTDDFPGDEYWAPPGNLPEFDRLLLDLTPLPTMLGGGAGRWAHQAHRQRILYLLDHLADVALDPEPTFCLAHIVGPHPPFVFGRDGSDVSRASSAYRLTDGKLWSDLEGHGDIKDYAAHYRDQATYLSNRVEGVVDQILARSTQTPVIIIQGDHGAGSHFDPDHPEPNDLAERMSILNLILLPGSERLYPTMTPVNTFRIVADQLFGTHLGLLPDRNYYSSYQAPYRLIEVTEPMTHQPSEPTEIPSSQTGH